MNEEKLTALEPRWIPNSSMGKIGVSFLCPACPDGHRIRVRWEKDGDHLVWQKTGYTFDDLTLSPSIDGTPSCKFHGEIKNGLVTWPGEKSDVGT